MNVLIRRILKQLKNDKRLLALVFVAPLLVLSLIYLLLSSNTTTCKVAFDTGNPILKMISEKISDENIELVNYDKIVIKEDLQNGTLDAVITMEDNRVVITLLEPNSAVLKAVSGAISDVMTSSSNASALPGGDIKTEFLYGDPDAPLFDSYGHIMLAIISFFFIFILTGIAFIRERTQGTLERFILSPIKRGGIIAGYTIAYGILAAIQSVIIVLYASYVLGMHLGKAIPLTILIMVTMGMAAVSIGFLVSVISHNEFQVVQFIPVILLPQVFFSGLIPLDAIPFGLGNLAYVMPLYYGCDALKHAIIYQSSITAVLPQIIILWGLILILGLLNTLILRQYRKI